MEHEIIEFLMALVAIFFGAKLFGEVSIRLGYPSVMGELIAGIILGGSVLHLIPESGTIVLLAEVGVIILLFEIGLETELKELLKVGTKSLAVAAVGVIAPFAGGWIFASALGLDGIAPIFLGAALTATSVGITSKVLVDLGKLSSKTGRIILGAAVIDDIIGLIILAVMNDLAKAGAVQLSQIAVITGKAIGFLAVFIIVGKIAVPFLMNHVEKMKGRGSLAILGLGFAFLAGVMANSVESAMIVGAFAAGLVIPSVRNEPLVKELKPIADFFTPIFFVHVGSLVNVSYFNPFNPANKQILIIGLGLIVVAIIGKLICGFSVFDKDVNKLAIGVGMIPRGEVGLIFAEIGRRSGAINNELFAAVVVMVGITTFIAPPLLKMILQVKEAPIFVEAEEDLA